MDNPQPSPKVFNINILYIYIYIIINTMDAVHRLNVGRNDDLFINLYIHHY